MGKVDIIGIMGSAIAVHCQFLESICFFSGFAQVFGCIGNWGGAFRCSSYTDAILYFDFNYFSITAACRFKSAKRFWQKIFPFLYKAPPINPKAPTTLAELIGNERAKIEIREVAEMLSAPAKYKDTGAQIPKGMLFIGPPGVGKTLFARAIANEIGVPFFVLEGSSVSGIIMGLGVFKLKTLFAKLRKFERSILFIDEIDSMAARRTGDRGFGGVSDMNMTLNALLTEMDGFYGSNMMVIGATNNDAILDPAIMRAGRMDRRIYFETPNPEERKELFRYYLKKVNCDIASVDLEEVAMLTANYSPAEIAGGS